MCDKKNAKALVCELAVNSPVNDEVFTLSFSWNGPAPKAGQFFMVKPLRCSVFLGRPLSVAEYSASDKKVKFLVARRGKGTEELAQMLTGEKTQLTGPLGNAWADFLPENSKIALIGGGVGIAPLACLIAEQQNCDFHLYAGFRNGFRSNEEKTAMLGAATNAKKLIIAAEDWQASQTGRNGLKGRIVDFFDEGQKYAAVFACGPEPMLKAVKTKCEKTPCFFSLERRTACGVGACLGCTVHTVQGNRRCCADGPIFAAQEIIFDD